MANGVIVHGFETSNNMKVRVALGYKDIPYDFHSIDPADRSEVVRLSGQHLTPVMEHGDRVLFDSAAILRYLDANFPDRPRLFGSTVSEQWAIEDQELFARTALAGPMMEVVHHRVSGNKVDEAMQARCAEAFARASSQLVMTLAGCEWLVGDRMSAADITAAAVIYRIQLAGLFDSTDLAPIAGWVGRVMAYDRYLDP